VDTTYKAIGWFRAGTGVVSGMANINGGVGDTLLAGEMYRVRLQLNRKLGPLTPVVRASPVAGWVANSTEQIEGIELAVWGAGLPGNSLEPCLTPTIVAFSQALALRAPTIAAVGYPTGTIGSVGSVAAGYVAGSFRRTFTATWNSATGNSANWNTFSFGGTNHCAFRVLLSAPCAKTTDDTLTLTFEKSWGRDLSEFV
jgi:hypothetical protein